MQPEESLSLPVIELEGTPREMGEAYGESCRDAVHELYAIRMKSVMAFAWEARRRFSEEQVLEVCRQCLPPTEAYDPAGYEEFCGIGRGAGLSPEQVFALNGLTDLRDALAYGEGVAPEGCTSFIVAPDRAAAGQLLIGQTWDLYTSNMPYLRLVHRKPADGPETLSTTTVGCLTLIGVNSEGIAVGNTNLRTKDSRIGVQYLSVLHRALQSSSPKEAATAVADAPRVGAHYYYLGGPNGRAVGLECSAAQHARFDVAQGTFVHCNHCLDPGLAELEVDPPADSTRHRQDRLTELLAENRDGIGVEDLKRMLSDHEGDELAICRHHGSDSMSTNACIIMSPGTREIHACRGQPHVGQWTHQRL